MKNGKFYGIQNSYNEWNSRWTRFCVTLEDAKRELQNCSDWYCPKGTGTIYEISFSISEQGVITFSSKRVSNSMLR